MRSCPPPGEHHQEQYDPGEGHEKQDGRIVTIKSTTADCAITCGSTKVLGEKEKESISICAPRIIFFLNAPCAMQCCKRKLHGESRGKRRRGEGGSRVRLLTVAPSAMSHTSVVPRTVPSDASAFATSHRASVLRVTTVSYPSFFTFCVKVMFSFRLPSIYHRETALALQDMMRSIEVGIQTHNVPRIHLGRAIPAHIRKVLVACNARFPCRIGSPVHRPCSVYWLRV